MEKMERELVAIKSINDESAIRYSNLGFKSQRESDAWFESNLPNDDYGLLMDFNMVCEHVFIQLAGQKILTNLNQVHKMKLSNNNQAVALTSFETRIPKLFCGEGKGVGIVREGESYFKTIKTWDDWDTPNDGFRDQIKRELTVFSNWPSRAPQRRPRAPVFVSYTMFEDVNRFNWLGTQVYKVH